MTDIRFYNNDPRYEMMYALLPDPQFENLPDAPQILEDLQEVIKLRHHYTLEAGTAKEKLASELADAIINHLFTTWAIHKTRNLAEDAEEYWSPSAPDSDEPDANATPSDQFLIP